MKVIAARNWFASLFMFISPEFLWASQGQEPLGSNVQIIETQGSFDTFAIGAYLQDRKCLEQVEKNVYLSDSGSAIVIDKTGQIQEIMVTSPGIFTQRYVTIGQSTMRDVLQRYGSASIETFEKLVLLSYPNIVFVFQKGTSESDPLLQKVRFITLRQSGASSTPKTVADIISILARVIARMIPTLTALGVGGGGPPEPYCNSCLWNRVYHSQRLIVRQQCISVTGTIMDATNGGQPDGVRHEPDGDAHGWLKVDSEFQNLLSAENISFQGGNLVFEIVCRFPVTQADAKAACQGYSDHVSLPPVGSHVRIVGTYVQDTVPAHWMEIHPVTSITVIP